MKRARFLSSSARTLIHWGEEDVGKPSEKIISSRKSRYKKYFQKQHTLDIRHSLRWFCICMQLFYEVFGVADLGKGGNNFHSGRTLYRCAKDRKTQTVNKFVTQSKCVGPQTPKKQSSGSFNHRQTNFYTPISGCHVVLFSLFLATVRWLLM